MTTSYKAITAVDGTCYLYPGRELVALAGCDPGWVDELSGAHHCAHWSGASEVAGLTAGVEVGG
jgi:hypothetical protein